MEDKGSVKAGGFGLLNFYYVLTPLFLVMELVWGIRVRVPFLLASAGLRYGYYGMCFLFGLTCYFRRKLMPIVAIFESTINIALLIGGFYLTILHSGIDFATSDIDEAPEVVTYKEIIGFVLALAIWMIAFKRGEWILFKGKHHLK
ncbi:MAG: hypothetical protein GWN94_03105 [Phycisphaerae bacterium]|nr:hypothetical protein [Phycisphaerae bacterium]